MSYYDTLQARTVLEKATYVNTDKFLAVDPDDPLDLY